MLSLTTKDIERKLQDIIAEVCCQDGTTPALDQTLDQVGADSLDYVEVLLGCEEEFGLDIDEAAWQGRVNHDTTTLEQIAGYLAELVEVGKE